MAENPIYVTVSGAGNNSGDSWANAMALADWVTDMVSASADDHYFVEEGTYTLTGNMDASAVNGTSTAPIKVTGVVSGTTNEPPEFSDYAFNDDRPLIAAGSYQLYFGDYWIVEGLRVTSAETWGLRVDDYSILYNCKCTTSGGVWTITALGSSSQIIGCEADCYAGGVSTKGLVYSCYIHDGTGDGVECGAGDTKIIKCVIDTMGVGIDVNSRLDVLILHNTIYNNTTGISGSTGHGVVVLDNIIKGNTTGASWTTEYPNNFFDYNCWDNTTDVSNVTKGPNSVTGDPSMTDPANGDFSIPYNSNCVDVALDAGDLTDATV